uniref:Transposase n=1 Tax=Elaeophora elaphi TaxID=1147741 RepID=A0A0R3RRK1_9BILA
MQQSFHSITISLTLFSKDVLIELKELKQSANVFLRRLTNPTRSKHIPSVWNPLNGLFLLAYKILVILYKRDGNEAE